jgi:hypothetical protein
MHRRAQQQNHKDAEAEPVEWISRRAIPSAANAMCHPIANQRQSFATAVAHERMLSAVATTHRTQQNA